MDIDEDAYRCHKPLPYELVQHIGIFFEEKLYAQALALLFDIVTTTTGPPTPVFVPPPQHLALSATLLVHPATTTRAKSPAEEEAPAAALRLLRLANNLVGPLNSRLGVAFSFTHFQSSRQGRRRRGAAEDDTFADPEDAKQLNLELAQSAALWSRAEDFWHAVGWAFNCSVLHRERWDRWRVWLEFMCEVLEDDWRERMRLAEVAALQNNNDAPNGTAKRRLRNRTDNQDQHTAVLRDSLICRYITDPSAGFGRNRRILRAVFADGSSSAVSEFRQVFHNELRPLRNTGGDPPGNIKKREVEVNVDQGVYGDYLTEKDDDDDDLSTTEKGTPSRKTKRPRRATRSTTTTGDTTIETRPQQSPPPPSTTNTPLTNDASLLGGLTSLSLRQRLLELLSQVSQKLPREFLPLEDLYHLFVENIRHQPLPIYQALISPSTLSYLSPAAHTTLCEFLLYRLRESAAPDSNEDYLNQTKLESCFLPFAASTAAVADNAKMSIALEALVMLLAQSDLLTVTDGFRSAVECGIEARAEKVQTEGAQAATGGGGGGGRGRGKGRVAEDVEWSWLIESGERLMFLLEVVG
ncbi:uncharacterized protein BDW47DRAFT_124028 [Aspergillus candidus]|uniref:Uncharacterized protein n=1 Tax=Aspergillus candidus TaxID=41067 RepID=A0A2I2FHK3_ASPCN|nr:hypothetical protein BDW47DRAFT_124028 [Aspergillus candidus]PLB40089.1 hypothetical protein BDW47DRAFT_124028 [Aspergillus candidus]